MIMINVRCIPYLCSFPASSSSQVCQNNYTISSGETIIVTKNASVCLICPQNKSNQWTIAQVQYTPTSAPYVLSVPAPLTTLNAVPVMCSRTPIIQSAG